MYGLYTSDVPAYRVDSIRGAGARAFCPACRVNSIRRAMCAADTTDSIRGTKCMCPWPAYRVDSICGVHTYMTAPVTL